MEGLAHELNVLIENKYYKKASCQHDLLHVPTTSTIQLSKFPNYVPIRVATTHQKSRKQSNPGIYIYSVPAALSGKKNNERGKFQLEAGWVLPS